MYIINLINVLLLFARRAVLYIFFHSQFLYCTVFFNVVFCEYFGCTVSIISLIPHINSFIFHQCCVTVEIDIAT